MCRLACHPKLPAVLSSLEESRLACKSGLAVDAPNGRREHAIKFSVELQADMICKALQELLPFVRFMSIQKGFKMESRNEMHLGTYL